MQQQPQYCHPGRAARTIKQDKEMPGRVILTSFNLHRYYFVVEEDNTPLSVTVTPCDAPLEWKLTLQELPEEASGESSGTVGSRGGG